MMTLAQAFSDALSEIDEKYILEAIEYQHRKKTRIIPLKWVLIAAVLLAGLTISAVAAVRALGLRDLVLPPPDSGTVQVSPGQPALTDQENTPVNTAPTHSTLSLSGYMNTPESQALAEWQAFLEQYDQDHTILASVGNYIDPDLNRYIGYLVYTREMMNELERIADKYGLKLHTDSYDLFAHPELLAPCEGFLGLNQGSATYMYEDGSFHVDGMGFVSDYGIVDYQLKRSVRGTLHTSYLTVPNVTEFQEWEYETSCGVPVLLALGPSRALVLADLEDCFVTVTCLAGTDTGLTAEHLEQMADSFDFSKLDPVVVPDLTGIPNDATPSGPAASTHTTARETYAAVLRDLLYSGILPDGTVVDRIGRDMSTNRFAVLDVTGDGAEELILLYTTTSTSGRLGMVLTFDGTYTGTARPVWVHLAESPMLTFYDDGYIAAAARHNQTWGELWPYTLYRGVADGIADTYFMEAEVTSMDKQIMEAAGIGDEYPEHVDISGSGTVYKVEFTYLSETGSAGSYLWDVTEYEAWLAEVLGDAKELVIPYQSLTEENISRMEVKTETSEYPLS